MYNLLATTLTLLASPALAGDWELGIGTRDSLAQAATVEGARLSGRYVRQGWAVEAGVFASPLGRTASPLGRVISSLASEDSTLSHVETLDRATADLRLDLGAAPADRRQRLAGGPHLYLGAESRLIERYAVSGSFEEGFDTSAPETVLAVGPTFGAGLDAWYRGKVGLRLVVEDRLWWGEGAAFLLNGAAPTARLYQDPTTSLDLLLSF
ncbi:MAG: hypothetical protein JXX28_07500 [Deltaproteobacteria bacterium]|nr:hypothetical protein [Deltaproteobacteria bacterium]